MEKLIVRKIISAVVIGWLAIFSFSIPIAIAASTTIGPSPQNGSFGKPFTVDMIVDGHSDKFNAAQATISLSPNIKITDLTLGDCNFSFLHTPSAQDPSFAGVIISTYSTKCTVYTMTLIPITKGQATITLSKSHVKRYGDAAEILSSTIKGFYNLTNISTVRPEMKNTSKPGLYTLYLRVTNEKNTVTNATVTLNAVSAKYNQRANTDGSGTAHFSNLQSGVYEATITQEANKIGDTIVNVSGPNHVLTLGIDLASQKNNPLMKTKSMLATFLTNPLLLIVTLIVGVIFGVGIALLIIKLLSKKQN